MHNGYWNIYPLKVYLGFKIAVLPVWFFLYKEEHLLDPTNFLISDWKIRVKRYCANQKKREHFDLTLILSNRKKNSQETQIYTFFLQKSFAKLEIK